MYTNEIQKRMMNLIDKNRLYHNRAYGLALYKGADPEDINDTYHLALWFEGAEPEVKTRFLAIFDDSYGDTGLRICDVCGKFITEGYMLFGLDNYACSRECAIKIFQWNGLDTPFSPEEAEKRLDRALEEQEDDNFWTEWCKR